MAKKQQPQLSTENLVRWLGLGTNWEITLLNSASPSLYEIKLGAKASMSCPQCRINCSMSEFKDTQLVSTREVENQEIQIRGGLPFLYCSEHGLLPVTPPWIEGGDYKAKVKKPRMIWSKKINPPSRKVQMPYSGADKETEALMQKLHLAPAEFKEWKSDLEKNNILKLHQPKKLNHPPVISGRTLAAILDLKSLCNEAVYKENWDEYLDAEMKKRGHQKPVSAEKKTRLRQSNERLLGPLTDKFYIEIEHKQPPASAQIWQTAPINQTKSSRQNSKALTEAEYLKIREGLMPMVKKQYAEELWSEHAEVWIRWAKNAIASKKTNHGWSQSRKAAFAVLLSMQLASYPKALRQSLFKILYKRKKGKLAMHRIVTPMCAISEGLFGAAKQAYRDRPRLFFAILRGNDLSFNRKRQSLVTLPAVRKLKLPSGSSKKFSLIISEGEAAAAEWLQDKPLTEFLAPSGVLILLRQQIADMGRMVWLEPNLWFTFRNQEVQDIKRIYACILAAPEPPHTDDPWGYAKSRRLEFRPMIVVWNSSGDKSEVLRRQFDRQRIYYPRRVAPVGSHKYLVATWREMLKICAPNGGQVLGNNLATDHLMALLEVIKSPWKLWLDEKSAARHPEAS